MVNITKPPIAGLLIHGTEDVSATNPLPVSLSSTGTDKYSSGTREYNFAQGSRVAFTSTSTTATALGTLGPSREILLISNQRCFIRFGASDLGAAAATAGVLPLPSDSMFHMKVPVGVTHYRVIRDTVDGFLSVIPVV